MMLEESASTVGVWSNIRSAITGKERGSSARQAQWSRVAWISDSGEKLIQKDGQVLRRLMRDLEQSQAEPQQSLNPVTQTIAEAVVAIAGSGELLQQILTGEPSLLTATSHQHGVAGLPASLSRLPGNRSDALRFAGMAAHAVVPRPVVHLTEPETIAEANKYVIHFLKKNNDRFFHDPLAVSSQLLLRAAVDCLIKNPRAGKQLSRRILKDRTQMSGSDAVLPERSSAIRQWLSGLLFKDGIDAFIIRHLGEAESDAQWTSARLHDAFRQKVYDAVLADVADEDANVHDAAIAHFVFEEVIYRVAPALRYAKEGIWTDLTQLEWGKVNAGLLFVQRHGADIRDFSEAEALALGSMLLVAIAARQTPVAIQDLFMLAAQCHAVLTGHDSDCDGPARETLLEAYFAFNAQFTDTHCPLANFSRLEQNFQTRTQLAQQRIDRECPQMSVTHLLNTDDAALCLYPFTTAIGKYLLPRTLKSLSRYVFPERLFVESVNGNYQQQVNDIAAAYATLDRMLSFVALSDLGEPEVSFIEHARLQKMQATFDARHLIYHQSASRNQAQQGHLSVGLAAGVDIYAARHDGQERIYALRRTRSAYEARRIDRNATQYLALAENSRPVNDPDYQLRVSGDGKPLEQKPGEMFGELLRQMSKEHQEIFAKQMYALGFDATAMQHVEAFILSLLPFYTCITEIEQGSHEAILACAVDVMLLFSAIGNVGRVALKVSDSGLKAGLMALRSTTGEVAARHATRAATVARSPLPSLSRTVNPGVVSAASTGATELDAMLNFGGALKNYLPTLETALPKLSFVQKVSIIRKQGLSGGHGLPPQAAPKVKPLEHVGSSMWSARGPGDTIEVNAALLRQMQGKKITQQEMTRIASEHNVDVHALSNHIRLDGQLTALGRGVLNRADSLTARSAAASVGTGEESGLRFEDEIAEWLNLNQQQRYEVGGILGFSNRHRMDPASFERAFARRNSLSRVSAQLPKYNPITATLLRDWQVWNRRYGASNESILRFWNSRNPSVTEWVRYVAKDGSLTSLGHQLLGALV